MNSPKSFKTTLLIGSLLLGLGALSALGRTVDAKETLSSMRPTPNPILGKETYLNNCARCHGMAGAADGWDASKMFPLPRDFSEGIFKFRTTASGTAPTDADLFRTITNGLTGSRMPDFERLSEDIRWQLVYYIKSLSTAFEDSPPESLDFGTDPGVDQLDALVNAVVDRAEDGVLLHDRKAPVGERQRILILRPVAPKMLRWRPATNTLVR